MKLKRLVSTLLSSAVLVMSLPLDSFAAYAQSTTGEPNAIAEVETQNVSVKGASSIGNILADEISEAYDEQLSGNGCRVQSVTITGSIAEVEFSTTCAATLVVGIYDESGKQLLGSGSLDVFTEETTAEIPVEISSMPDYFSIKAYLVDKFSLEPVSSVYENNNYTQKMQEFLSKTVDDFDPSRVINFNEDKTANFAVYSENTKLIPYAEGVNVITSADETNGIYIFENIDENISSLQPGDIFSYDCGNEYPLIIKVDSIEINGTTAEIHCAKTTLSEIFEHFEVEQEQDISTAKVDKSTLDPGVTLVESEETESSSAQSAATVSSVRMPAASVKGEGKYEHEFNIEWDEGVTLNDEHHISFQFLNKKPAESEKDKVDIADGNASVAISANVKGSLDLTTTLSLVIYDGNDADKYIEASFSIEAGVNLTLSATLEASVPLVTLGWMVYAGIFVEITPSVVTRATGTATLNGKLTMKMGFRLTDTGNGIKYDDISSNPEFSAGLKVKGEYFIGLSLEPRIKVIHEWIGNVTATAEGGIKLVATLEEKGKVELFTDKEEETQKHDCTSCITGETFAVVNISLSGTILGCNLLNITILDLSIPMHDFDFYYSLDHDEFKFGSCPYRSYKIEIDTANVNTNIPIEGAELTIDDSYVTSKNETIKNDLTGKSDENGKASFWVHEGAKKLSVKANKYEDYNLNFRISVETSRKDKDSALTRTVCINAKETTEYSAKLSPVTYPVNVSVVDEDGETVQYASIHSDYPYEKADIYNTGYMGSCTVKLPEGTWTISTGKVSGYEEGSADITIKEGAEDLSVVITLRHDTGFTEFTVHDQFGDPVVGAKVYIEKVGDTQLVVTIPVTDSTGYYSQRLSEGDYKLTLKKDGYETVTGEFTAVKDGLQLEYEMQCNLKNVNVSVVDTDGNPIEGAEISSDFNDDVYLTSSDGTAVVKLPVGDYTVKAACEGYVDGSAAVTVSEDGEETSVSITLEKDVTGNGTCGDNLFWEYANGTLRIYGTGEMDDYTSSNTAPWYDTPWYDIRKYIKNVIIEDGAASIGKYAFYNCSSLISITISDSLTSIGKYAFKDCTNLESITIPDSVISIGAEVFRGCTNLTSITIPDGVTSIGNWAFYECTSLASITIPDGVTSIGYGLFVNCKSLTSITIPNSVTSIGNSAFYGCSNLTSIILPTNVSSIENETFYKCSNLSNVNIPDSVTSIGESAFYGCSNLTNITIPDSVTCIGDNAFNSCDNLTSITIPNSVIKIGRAAFAYCSSLKKVKLSNCISSIPSSYVTSTSIYRGVFEGCTSLTIVIIPESVTCIGEDAFKNCTNLTDIYYSGTEEQWNNIIIGSYNYIYSATIHFNSTGAETNSLTSVSAFLPSGFAILSDETAERTVEFTGLQPSAVYNFYSMKSKDAENSLAPDNLLYINQYVSDESGNLTVTYIPREETESPEEFVMQGYSYIGSADISVTDLKYNGREQTPEITVSCGGAALAEGVDYTAYGDFSAADIGTYSITFNGIGKYTGTYIAEYEVICEHIYENGVCTICGSECSHQYYEGFCVICGEEEKQLLIGDVTQDGVINLYDVIEIAKSLMGMRTFTDEEKIIADYNCDGVVNLYDAVEVARTLLP